MNLLNNNITGSGSVWTQPANLPSAPQKPFKVAYNPLMKLGGYKGPTTTATAQNPVTPTAPQPQAPDYGKDLTDTLARKNQIFGAPQNVDNRAININQPAWLKSGFGDSNFGTLYQNRQTLGTEAKALNAGRAAVDYQNAMRSMGDTTPIAMRKEAWAAYDRGVQGANRAEDTQTVNTFNKLYNEDYANYLQQQAKAKLDSARANKANFLGQIEGLNDGTMEGAARFLRAYDQYVNGDGSLVDGAKYLTGYEAEQNAKLKDRADLLQYAQQGDTKAIDQLKAMDASTLAQDRQTQLTGLLPKIQEAVAQLKDNDPNNNAQALSVFSGLSDLDRAEALKSVGADAGLVNYNMFNSANNAGVADQNLNRLLNNPWGSQVLDSAHLVTTNNGTMRLKGTINGQEVDLGDVAHHTRHGAVLNDPRVAQLLQTLKSTGKLQTSKERGALSENNKWLNYNIDSGQFGRTNF